MTLSFPDPDVIQDKPSLPGWQWRLASVEQQALEAWFWAEPGANKPAPTEALTSPDGLKVLAVQNAPRPGALGVTGPRIAHAMQKADKLGVDLLVFPELALLGYPIRDVIRRYPHLVEDTLQWLLALIQRSGSTLTVVGFAEPRPVSPATPGKPFFNSLALIQHGKLQGIIRKQLLPTYGEYEDWRTFEPPTPAESTQWPDWCHRLNIPLASETPQQTINLQGFTVGFTICEDLWNPAGLTPHPLYASDPVTTCKSAGCDLLINASASVARAGKPDFRRYLLGSVAQAHHLPLLYVNQVGAVDECLFDGQTSLWNPNGECAAQLSDDQPGVLLASLKPAPQKAPQPAPLKIASLAVASFSDQYQDHELARTYRMACLGIREYFAQVGFQRAVLGISGGIDSAVAVVLLVDALGASNVLGVTMPTTLTPSDNQSDALSLLTNLGCPTVSLPITEMVNAGLHQMERAHPQLALFWGERAGQSFALDNVQAISRATLLRLLGNDYRALPIATSDKSEFYMGYTTVNGDMSGALAPLGDIPKTKVQALARWLNHNRPQTNAIPQAIVDRPPGADLALDPVTGKPLLAESALMPYLFVDEVIWRLENLGQSYRQLLDHTFEYEQQHGPLSVERKRQWLDKFFRRFAINVFKWWLAPPVLLMDGAGSITKTDYHHPIVATGVDWQGWTADRIADKINL